MRFKNLFIFALAYSHFVLIGATKNTTQLAGDDDFKKYQLLKEKKVHFTGNSAQYLKFDVKLPSILDFAMCIWYKPDVILEHNILLSYGNNDQQLILWKIKKKFNTPVLILKIYDKIVMEEKLEALTIGQWHHLCQYWQGSTGLWALFLNSYIISFGYKEIPKNSDWYIYSTNATLAINHPRTKRTLYGEIHGFYMLSTNSIFENYETPKKTILIDLDADIKSEKANVRKRQVVTAKPTTNPNATRAPFPLIRNFLKFIRRVVSFVTVPIFRFASRLIQPWRRRLTTPRPTTPMSTVAPAPVTELVTQNSTIKKNVTLERKNVTVIVNQSDTARLEEESMVIYESETEFESAEPRQSRNVPNGTRTRTPEGVSLMDSSEVFLQSTESRSVHDGVVDKCAQIEKKFNDNYHKKAANFGKNFVTTTTTESPIDVITYLGFNLLFTQFSFTCCPFPNDKLLISWDETPVLPSNVVLDAAAACGNF